MQLQDRVALVTGGRRIGADVALGSAARGADVALCYRESRAEAEATAHAIVKLGRRAQWCRPISARPRTAGAR